MEYKDVKFTDLSDEGSPLNTLENLCTLLNEYKIKLRYNAISRKIEAYWPGTSVKRTGASTFANQIILSLCKRHEIPGAPLKHLFNAAGRDVYNPILEKYAINDIFDDLLEHGRNIINDNYDLICSIAEFVLEYECTDKVEIVHNPSGGICSVVIFPENLCQLLGVYYMSKIKKRKIMEKLAELHIGIQGPDSACSLIRSYTKNCTPTMIDIDPLLFKCFRTDPLFI
jgi:hypothetical protein